MVKYNLKHSQEIRAISTKKFAYVISMSITLWTHADGVMKSSFKVITLKKHKRKRLVSPIRIRKKSLLLKTREKYSRKHRDSF